jgi:hypothetical protein
MGETKTRWQKAMSRIASESNKPGIPVLFH